MYHSCLLLKLIILSNKRS